MTATTASLRDTRSGFALTETLVALLLGLIASAAAAAAFHAGLLAYRTIVDVILLEERGQRALAIIGALVRQAGWPNMAPQAGPPVIAGRDNCGQPQVGPTPACGRGGPNGSDAVLIRFSGSGSRADPSLADGSMVDCSGSPVAAQWAGKLAPDYIATNLLYIATDADGEPQLMCRYPARRQGRIDGNGWTSGALVRGAEAMQLRYGIDANGDGRPDAFLTATELQAQPNAAWQGVVAIQVALRLRGQQPDFPALTTGLPPGPNRALADLGATSPARPARMRRTFATTIRLRNPPPCKETLC